MHAWFGMHFIARSRFAKGSPVEMTVPCFGQTEQGSSCRWGY
jgi:hypothetical protein